MVQLTIAQLSGQNWHLLIWLLLILQFSIPTSYAQNSTLTSSSISSSSTTRITPITFTVTTRTFTITTRPLPTSSSTPPILTTSVIPSTTTSQISSTSRTATEFSSSSTPVTSLPVEVIPAGPPFSPLDPNRFNSEIPRESERNAGRGIAIAIVSASSFVGLVMAVFFARRRRSIAIFPELGLSNDKSDMKDIKL
ncbi:hypothetical protein BKA69DRAFT_1101137 [Paraphysoderma sedebokerense]|nr:hypothetical protein BKA69DRAFT_1101137 [Paraphysoderma sedebokerense]